MRCRHPTAITHSEKPALRSCFPMCTAPLWKFVRAHSGKILSHSTMTRAGKRGTRESSGICLFLIGPASCCGCPASSAADAADIPLSRSRRIASRYKDRSLRFPKNLGFDESRIFFLIATGPASSVTPLTRATKIRKKQWLGHNELKTRFSNGPTKTEPALRKYRKYRIL